MTAARCGRAGAAGRAVAVDLTTFAAEAALRAANALSTSPAFWNPQFKQDRYQP